jgi:hypothetical protein
MRRFLACLVALAAFATPAAAQAANIVVDTTAPISSSACGLVNAVAAADADEPSGKCIAGEGDDQIEFDLPLPAEIVLTGAPLQISQGTKLTILGPGANQLTVSGNDISRVFEVGNEGGMGGETGDLTLTDLTIADGRANEIGAGLYIQYSSVARLIRVTVRDNEVIGSGKFAEGAGIMNQGVLTVADSTITGNVARNISPAAGSEANGAGITSERTKVVVERSTISGNSTILEAAAENGHARGGGIFAFTLTDLTVRDSTVSGNRVEMNTAPGNEAGGGGIFLFPVPGATIENSTIAGNTAPLGANFVTEGAVTIRSTIIARPLGAAANCAATGAGAITSLGYNLDDGSSCGFAGTGDQSNVDPRLAPTLAANGGPTETLALLNGSPAVDQGLAAPGETVDARGFKRPVEIPAVPNASGGDGADIGAFEVQVPRAEVVRGPAEGGTIAEAEPTFEFDAVGLATGFVCSLDGAVPAPCTSPFRTPKLANGGHAFTVTALGEAGYAGETVSRTFTVDVRTPAVPEPKQPTKQDPPKNDPPNRVAPRAKIGAVPAKTTKRRVKIRFSATEAGSTFQCKLDSRKWRGCSSPYSTPKLQLGKHVFRLKVTGPTGLTRSKPATKAFRVVARPSPGSRGPKRRR